LFKMLPGNKYLPRIKMSHRILVKMLVGQIFELKARDRIIL